MPEDFGRDIPVDPRQVQRLASKRSWATEQAGSRFRQDWGSAGQYGYYARMPQPERVVYFAVQEGYGTEKEIADVTGMSERDVSRGVQGLERKGLIARERA